MIACAYNLANRFYHINLVSNTVEANSSANPKASEVAILVPNEHLSICDNTQ